MQVSEHSSTGTATRICGKCGNKIPADAPQGLCSLCLFKSAIGSIEGEEPVGLSAAQLNFDDYELLQEIGRGGQGVVYRARQKSLNRTVALKVIGVGSWATEAHLKRFRFEAEAAAGLNHPFIVPIHEIRERGGYCYFSMNLIDGGQLDEVVKQRPLSIRRAAELIAKLARTVHYAHEHCIVHRDIKPGNILLDAKGEPHLTDFGLARLVETESHVTCTTDVLGTPNYMAPEQAAGGNTELTYAADIYALGAVFYQLLTERVPFVGRTAYETVRLVLEAEPAVPRLINPKVDRDLSTICLKCLEKDPKRRYASALALAEDLERWLRREPIKARPSGLFTRGGKWLQRNPASAVSIGALAALLVAVSVLIWESDLFHPPPTTGIAVLPFENLSENKNDAFLADGFQDDVLTKLAKIADLKVISRTSVMSYRGARNIRQIGDALHVSHVLEGSVRRETDRIHVNAQLIDARTDQHLWAEEYDRGLSEMFAVQSEIAQQIADRLQARLSPTERAAITERPTADPVAYAFYTEVKAIDAGSDWEGKDRILNREVELLEKATQRDPNFALAYCALAKAHGDLYFMIWDPKHLELAKKAGEAAVRVRPDLGETHLALARYYFHAAFSATGQAPSGINTGNFDRAREELTIARRKLPNNSEALFMAAKIDRRQNRWDAALATLQKASELDPRNGEVAYTLAETYFEMRRYQEVKKYITKDIANWPEGEPWTQLWLAQIKLAQGDPVAAQSLLEQIPLDFSPSDDIWENRFLTVLYLRDYDAADRVIAATPAKWAEEVFGGEPPDSWADGQIARARGDKEKALGVFAAARKKLDATWGEKPRDEIYFERAADFDAGLGRKEDAIREALRAVELTPITKDSLLGPPLVTNLALVYAWTAERERALEQLEIVAKIPAGPSYGDLRFNPCWDSLRGDPRFEKLVASLAPK